jgi:glycosyltransferase involved in cell wall biosynthesis
MMRIAYINSFYAPEEIGGAEKSVRFLAEQMAARGHETHVLCLGREASRTEMNGVQVHRVPIRNFYYPTDAGKMSRWQKLAWHGVDSYNPLSATVVAKWLDTIKPDVVHTNTLSGFSVSAWGEIKRRGIRIVHSLRDYYLLCPNTAMFRNGKPCETRCLECTCLAAPRANATAQVDCVVGNSKFILDKHVKGGLFKNAARSVIYNAYSAPPIIRTPRNGRPSCFGYIGRLAPTKGVETIISAAKILNEQLVDLEVVIAGEGDPGYVDELKRQASGLPIRFLGRVDPGPFYDSIDWCIVPSIWDEPLARVLFESFCHGVPVIGSNTGGTPEMIEPGFNGWLFEPADESKLSQIMEDSSKNTSSWVKYSANALGKREVFEPEFVCAAFLSKYAPQ